MHLQLALDVVDAAPQLRRTLRALARKPAEGSLPSGREQAAVQRHGLRRVLDGLGDSRPQAVRRGLSAAHACAVVQWMDSASHASEPVQQAHAAAVRNAPRDAGAVEVCGGGHVVPCMSATSSTLAKGVPCAHRDAVHLEAQALEQQPSSRPAAGPRSATRGGRGCGSRCGPPTGWSRCRAGWPRRPPAAAGAPPGLQGLAHAAQHALLGVEVARSAARRGSRPGRYRGQRRRAHVTADELPAPAAGGPSTPRRAPRRLRHQLDAGVVGRGSVWPSRPRASGPGALHACQWPTAGSRAGPGRSRCPARGAWRAPIRPRSIRPRKTGSRPSLPRAKCPGEAAGLSYTARVACLVQLAPRGVGGDAAFIGFRPGPAAGSRRAGRRHRIRASS